MKRHVDHEDRIAAARRAVAEACQVCRVIQRSAPDMRTMTKDDRSPVTIADFASQAVVAHRLREALGSFRMVAEESSAALRRDDHAWQRDQVVRAVRSVWADATEDDVLDAIDAGATEPGEEHRDVFWTLDPIDGTKGFLRGEQYAISLAWVQAGAPVLGLLGCPNLSADFGRPFDDPDPRGCIYLAEAGSGLYELPANEPDATPLHIRRLERDPGEPVRVCESVESAHSSQSDTIEVLRKLGGPNEVLRLDSQAKYAVVARGQADAYLRMPTRKGYVERIWDHAAGAIIAMEGGCAVSDIRGELLDFGRGPGLEENAGVLCAPPALHGRLLGVIGELGLNSSSA